LVDEFQWFTPEMAKLVLERADDTSKVVCMFDSKQRYASKQRPDGAKDLLDRVTKVDESGVRYVTESLFGYVKMDSSENRRGALSKRVTEIYDDLDFDKSKIKN
jgi:predicted ribonuclease YlaK